MYLTPSTIVQYRYEVHQLIGSGGMGAVYEAFDQRLNRLVALKQLKQDLHITPEARRAFAREAQLLATLRHPALPVVIDHFDEQGDLFLVMDLIPGYDLGALLQQRRMPFPPLEVLGWADQILDALEYLHHQATPVIHRDIKPGNLRLSLDERIYLLDFGISKGMADAHGQQMSSFGATLAYAPLEQLDGRSTNARSDLYSLAATIYQLLAYEPPKPALHRRAAMIQGGPDPLSPLHNINPQLPGVVSDVLMKALALDPEDRYSSAAEMRRALLKAAEVVSQPAAPTQLLAAHAPPPVDETILLGWQAPMDAAATVAIAPGANPQPLASATPAQRPATGGGLTGKRRLPPAGIIGAALLVALAALGSFLLVGKAGQVPSQPGSPTSAFSPTRTVGGIVATSQTSPETPPPTVTVLPTGIPSPTATPEPPTATPEPPTATPEPPTATPEPPTAVPPPPQPTAKPAPTRARIVPTSDTSPNP